MHLNKAEITIITANTIYVVLYIALTAWYFTENFSRNNDAAGAGVSAGLTALLILAIIVGYGLVTTFVSFALRNSVSHSWIKTVAAMPTISIPVLIYLFH